jgi:NADPH:quinone reductase-like Zn-dependent oxidoreductase
MMMKRVDLVQTGGFCAGTHLLTVDVAAPTCRAGEVIVSVKASGINPVDYKMADYGFLLPETLPACLGCDVAGVIVEAPGNENNLVGQRVVAHLGANKAPYGTTRGAFGEQVAVFTEGIAEIPDSMTFSEAATLPVGALTAKLLVQELGLKQGSWVLVWGASSSVGYNVVQLAVKLGLKPIAVASEKHQAMLKELGAAGFVDYRNDNVAIKVKELIGNDKLNGAVDCIGGEPSKTCAGLLVSLGDDASSTPKVVASVAGLPESPAGVNFISVMLGLHMDKPETRLLIKEWLPEMVNLKTMPIHSIKGPFTAETVEAAFQASKNGVSGEKVVIEWN